MPTYEYKCPSCDTVKDVSHPMGAKHFEKCKCGTELKKIFSAPNICSKKNTSKTVDRNKKLNDMRTDLRTNYNVHEVAPLGGRTYEQIYHSIKKDGTRVAEDMSRRIEGNRKQQAIKSRIKSAEMSARAPELRKKRQERLAKEKAEKGKINLS